MIERGQERFAGYECARLSNGTLTLWVTRDVGPRIIGLALPGGKNLLAELPDARAQFPGTAVYSFRGGHRLWYGPEDPWHTYQPDDAPVAIEPVEEGLHVVQPVEQATGIQKSMTIRLADDRPLVTVDHELRYEGDGVVVLAPWAITQLKWGGVAILPQAVGPVDKHGLLPNRHLVLWPYTQLEAPLITWGDGGALIDTRKAVGPFKIGFGSRAGWLAYGVDETLFVKQAAYQPGAEYLDGGSSSECYCNTQFLELETLGPVTTLAPGEAVTHREVWSLYPGVSVPRDVPKALALVERLELAEI